MLAHVHFSHYTGGSALYLLVATVNRGVRAPLMMFFLYYPNMCLTQREVTLTSCLKPKTQTYPS